MHMPVLTAVEQAARKGLRKAGREVLKKANALAPQDDGDLIKSGRVVIDDMTVQVSWSAIHAPLQHENLDWQHTGGGGPKFAERAMTEVDIPAIVAAAVRRELGG